MPILKPIRKKLRTTYAMQSGRGRPLGTPSKKWFLAIEETKRIVKEYDLPLTVRQIFYRLVARQFLLKTKGNYAFLCKKLVEQRQLREVEWSRIVDLTRKPIKEEWIPEETLTPQEWFNYYRDKFEENVQNFHFPLYENQDFLIEVWCEHEGLKPLFEKALEDFPITLYFTRGNNSWSNFYTAYQRLKTVNRKIIILHFSDCDKFGLDMTRNIKEAFDYFDRDNGTHLNVEVRRIALIEQQVEEWSLPDTQLEAIEPNRLAQLVYDSIEKLIDKQKLSEMWEKIREGRKETQELLDRIIYD